MIFKKVLFNVFHIHIPIWQHGSCIHLAMSTKPPPVLINSLHPNNAIQSTLYINQCIQYDYDQNQSCTLHLHKKYSFLYNLSVHFITLLEEHYSTSGVSNLLTKCAKILAKNL